MQHRLLGFLLFVGWPIAGSLSASAHTTTLALTGAEVLGLPTATWGQFQDVSLNNAGTVAFTGHFQHSDQIDADNDLGLWLYDDTGQHLLAQTGSGSVPGILDTDFVEFDIPQLSETNEVFVSGRLLNGSPGVTSDSDEGLWRFSNSSGSLELRTGSGNVPDVGGANFQRVPSFLGDTDISLATNGNFAFRGELQPGIGGVLSSSDRGLWSYQASGSSLLAREGVQSVPGVSGANFSNFVSTSVNSNEQVVVKAVLKSEGGITSSNSLGIWFFQQSTGQLLARTGDGNVPGFPAESFVAIEQFHMNESGQVAVDALVNSPTMTGGIWLYTDSSSQLVASQATDVPGVSDARFESFNQQAMNDHGQILTLATLQTGVGNVASGNERGLWILNDDESLVARSGIGNVPGVPNANFSSFSDATLNDQGQVAFTAELQVGDEIDTNNNQGLWVADPLGESWLVARTGDEVDGRTIASIFLRVGGENDRTTGFNELGEVAYRATFTNGDSGLFLFRPYASDFDRNAEVDSADLAMWETAYGTSSVADADVDDDSDGADYLVWQREFGSGSTPQPILSEIPEPASSVLLVVALFISPLGCRHN